MSARQGTPDEDPPKHIELLAAIFGGIGVAKDVPPLVRLLCGLPNDPQAYDRWILWVYAALVVALALMLGRKQPNAVDRDSDNSFMSRATRLIARRRRWQIVKSLGFVLVRERILGWLGVKRFNVFVRPHQWPLSVGRTNLVMRIRWPDDRGTEYQFSSMHDNVYVRDHEPSGATSAPLYGSETKRPPTRREMCIFAAASWSALLWCVRRLTKRCSVLDRQDAADGRE